LIRLSKSFGELTLKKADNVIAVSEYERFLITQLFRINPEKVVVIPNGVDFSEFSGLAKRNHDFKSILYVGYLGSYKGVQHLIEVLPRLRNDVVLEIVGRGPLKPYLERRAKELKVYDKVRFYHDLPRRELLQKYADADVFALLSKYEAYSLVIAEALVAGTPCIVTKTSALNEWVDNNTCLGVDFPINLKDLSSQIEFALDKKVDRETMKKWFGTKILDWKQVTERLEKIYSE